MPTRNKHTGAPLSRSEQMSRVRSKDTTPELLVRSALHRLGFRYRLHVRTLPGCPDLVFPSRRTVIFIHGCFWHGHDCKRGARVPKTNSGYWREKIERNRSRDAVSEARLAGSGWNVLVVWECELVHPDTTISRLVEALSEDNALDL
jgi:DNA mismatch endonuclease (patch repair protein)